MKNKAEPGDNAKGSRGKLVTQQIVARPARNGMFFVLTVAAGGEAAVRDVLTKANALTRSVSFRRPYDGLLLVVGLGSQLWDRMFPDQPKPLHLHPFEEIRGDQHVAVATAGDLLLHLRGDSVDVCFELAQQLLLQLGDSVSVVDEVHGFKFFDDRDLLGFVDGTENPEGDKAVATVTVGQEDAVYAGSSYVIIQKYLHDLEAWRALTVEEQTKAIGRSKLDDIEMPDDQKPTNSHVALNTIVDADGTQRQILRDNLPFGRVGEQEFGTFFIGYAADPGVTEEMLRNMFVGKPKGNHDRILDFSTAVTGSLYFVPTSDFLDNPPGS